MRALALLLWLAAAQAQPPPLDLRPQPVAQGTVASIREVGTPAKKPPPPGGTEPVGVPSELDQGAPVGAVLYLPFGGSSGPKGDRTWRFGAAGTPEMQAEFGKSAYEVVVVMDDGERRAFRPQDPGRFRIGQRVSVRAGELVPLGGT